MTKKLDAVLSQFEADWNAMLEELKTLVRIPSISFPGYPREKLEESAEAVAALFRRIGLPRVELLRVGEVFPYIYAESHQVPGRPTVVLYAHHDVQPIGREAVWKSNPFEPTLRDGPGGPRLYGRGTADDKAGILVHAAAIGAYLKAWGDLPVNIKIVIEGEEEIGSGHLPEFLKKYADRFKGDVLVLTDTSNFDCGVPSLTVALRGLVAVNVEVKALSKTVHSGMWGGPVPDPVMALSKVLATLVDEKGHIAVPGIRDLIPPLTAKEEAEYQVYPFDEKAFREQSGMLPGVQLLRQGPNPNIQLWRYPSLTVTAIQASSRASAGNIINDTAWARVTVRVAPGMDPDKIQKALIEAVQKAVPWGLSVEFATDHGAPGWKTDTDHPLFQTAVSSLEKGYGHTVVKMGCGGSIPFVQPFADALGGVPALLIGVEDPYTNAHGENESLLISDLKKACLSQIHLFADIAERQQK